MVQNYRGRNSLFQRARHIASMAALIGIATGGILAIQPAARADDASNRGPVRLARFSRIAGDVSWRPDDHAAWEQAAVNLPVRQGCQIWVPNGGRAELQFDDGSYLDMGRGALVTLRTLYSDTQGEFTELALRDGAMELRLRRTPDVYQVDTPFASVDATGPARCRVDATYGVGISDREGNCTIEGSRGKETLSPGEYVGLHSDNDPYDIRPLPQPDSFDDWAANRYAQDNRYRNSPSRRYLPADVAIVADDLDGYGTWRHSPQYGEVWYPYEGRRHGWRPYHHGHWTWVPPFGWTWVADEPWGWAPCHYGTWVDDPNGWGWVPGPVNQYWSPAVVSYYQYGSDIAWCPLAPAEVRYPSSLSIGISNGGFAFGYSNADWSLFFSIGGAAVYYPTFGGYAVPYPWAPAYVNNFSYVNNVTYVNNYYGSAGYNPNTFLAGSAFVPVNARVAAGATLASVSTFGGRGVFRSLPADPPAITRGRLVGAPGRGLTPLSGPPAARPTAISMTPTRVVRSGDPVPRAVLARPVRSVPGPIQNHVVSARQILTGAAGAAALVGAHALAGRVPGRIPGAAARAPQPGRPAIVSGQPARPAHGFARPPAAAPGMSREQRAAMQARNALGIRPGTVRNLPGNRPAQPLRAAGPAFAGARRPNAPPRIAGGFSQPQRAAMRARAAVGMRAAAGPAPRGGNAAPARIAAHAPQGIAAHAPPRIAAHMPQQIAAHAPQTPPHRTQFYRAAPPRPAPAAHRFVAPPVHHNAAPAHRFAAAAHPNAAPVRRFTPPAHRNATPVRRYTPPAHHYAAPVRHYAAPAHRYAAPVHAYAPPVRRYAAPVRRYSPPVRQYAAPVRRYAPPVRQYVPPARPAYSRPAPSPRPQRSAPSGGSRSPRDRRKPG